MVVNELLEQCLSTGVESASRQGTMGHVRGHLWLSRPGAPVTEWVGQGGCSTPHRAQDGPTENGLGPNVSSVGGRDPALELVSLAIMCRQSF